MGNCLITKLKVSVNNDDLLKIGEYRFSTKSGGNVYINPGNSAVKNITLNTDYPVGIVNIPSIDGNYVLSVDKYKVFTLEGTGLSINTNGLKFASNLTNIKNCYVSGDVSKFLEIPSLTILDFRPNNDLTGSISSVQSSLRKFKYEGDEVKHITINLKSLLNSNLNLQEFTCSRANISSFDTSGLVQNDNLTRFAIHINPISINLSVLVVYKNLTVLNVAFTSVSGNVEDLLSAMLSAGRTSGNLTFYGDHSSVKLNSKAVPDTSTILFAANSITMKNGADTIASYDGTSWTYYGDYA